VVVLPEGAVDEQGELLGFAAPVDGVGARVPLVGHALVRTLGTRESEPVALLVLLKNTQNLVIKTLLNPIEFKNVRDKS